MLDVSSVNLEQIKEQISVPSVLAIFGIKYEGNIQCLWHDDRSPSMQIFSDHGWCYACRKYADIFGFTMKLGKMSFSQAIEWLLKQKGIAPQTVIRKAPVEYLGPMPMNVIEYWQNELTETRRQYLYDRLILPETIEKYRLGYRPDYNAYTIPFWEGDPGSSDVIALQYRAAPDNTSNRKYWWERGRYKPCLLNQHVINPALTILVFGSFDSILGVQDGLPMPSASGLNTFTDPNKPESIMLREKLERVQHKVILPDGTPTEFEPAVRVMHTIGAKPCFFPFGMPKDYTDYRLSGKTPQQFVEEILEMATTWVDDRMYLMEEEYVNRLQQSLAKLFKGSGPEAYTEMLHVGKDAEVHSVCVTHAIQQIMDRKGPRAFGNIFTTEEWNEIIEVFSDAWESYTDIRDVYIAVHHRVTSRLGAF